MCLEAGKSEEDHAHSRSIMAQNQTVPSWSLDFLKTLCFMSHHKFGIDIYKALKRILYHWSPLWGRFNHYFTLLEWGHFLQPIYQIGSDHKWQIHRTTVLEWTSWSSCTTIFNKLPNLIRNEPHFKSLPCNFVWKLLL